MSNRIRHGFRPKSGWSETRRADRIAMRNAVCALCADYGVEHEVDSKGGDDIRILIKADTGLTVGVDFEKESIQPNIFVLSWHFRIFGNDWRVNPEVFRDHNDVHFRKATDVAHGWEDLKRLLERRLKQIADGTATITTEQLNDYTSNRAR